MRGMVTQANVTDRELTLNGLRFHYLDCGNAGAPALVCLHGFTSHAHSWDTFAKAMREQYHVLALDQRGHGETEWAKDYHADRRVEDLEEFVEALKLEKFVLLGLSMGGRVAFQYAAQHPDKLDRLVIVDVAPETSSSGARRIADGLRNKDIFQNPEGAFEAARRANPRPPADELRARTRYGLKQLDDGTWTFRYDVALRNGSGARVMPTPEEVQATWDSLQNITCPTLLVRGSDSDILSPELAQRMLRSMPNCRLVEVPNSGHSVPLDNPTGFIQAVRTFL
jgi:pimeloyl-ACP methyl ester carboxylesterase